MKKKILSEYELGQNYSFINRYLHARRYNVLEGAVERLLNENIMKDKKLKVLDIGCGLGKAFEVLSKNVNLE